MHIQYAIIRKSFPFVNIYIKESDGSLWNFMCKFQKTVMIVSHVKKIRDVIDISIVYHEAVISVSAVENMFFLPLNFERISFIIWYIRISQASHEGMAPIAAPIICWNDCPLNSNILFSKTDLRRQIKSSIGGHFILKLALSKSS